jgi:hypothetical protein
MPVAAGVSPTDTVLFVKTFPGQISTPLGKLFGWFDTPRLVIQCSGVVSDEPPDRSLRR